MKNFDTSDHKSSAYKALTSNHSQNIAATVIDALSDLPMISVVKEVIQAVDVYHNELELKKIATFFEELKQVSKADRERFIQNRRLEEDPQKFIDNIFLLLKRVDDMEKPKIIGRIWAACIRGRIPYSTAKRLSAIIDRSYISDLEYLKNFKKGLQGDRDDIATTLNAVGLLRVYGSDGSTIGDPMSGGTLYELNSYGEALIEFGLSPAQ